MSANQDASDSCGVRNCRRAVWPPATRGMDSAGRATMTQSEAVLAGVLAPRRAGVYGDELLWWLETDGRVWGVEIRREDRTGMSGIRGVCAEATAHDAMRVIVVVNNEGVWCVAWKCGGCGGYDEDGDLLGGSSGLEVVFAGREL